MKAFPHPFLVFLEKVFKPLTLKLGIFYLDTSISLLIISE
jgi:hypothetical protein